MNRTRSVIIFLSSLLILVGTEACGQQPDQGQVSTIVPLPVGTESSNAANPRPVGTKPIDDTIPQPVYSVEPPLNTATAAVQATAVAHRTATGEAYNSAMQTSISAAATALIDQAPTLTAQAINSDKALHPEPQSPRVDMNKPYPFSLYTHCGVDYSTDFDGSFWDAADKTDQPRSLGNPEQQGTMTLVDDSHARFDYEGGSVLFVRHVGPKVLPGFCR